MPTICIQGAELNYDDANIITFDEGLIGMPHLKYMVLVEQSDIAPFHWLASLDDARVAFLVVNPALIFPTYSLKLPDHMIRLVSSDGQSPTPLAIVNVADDWTKTTINLKAPLLVASSSMRGTQVPLVEGPYRLEEPLPQAA
jgi:flagellar assembly factor FliW